MIIITGTIKVESEQEVARLRDALARRAERSRADDGNIDYVFTQNLEDPTEVRLIEKWESEEKLNAHLQLPDDEFGSVMATAKIERAVVTSNDVASEKVLMER